MHIDKEVKALTTCFNNIQFSPKSGFTFIAHLPNSSSFYFFYSFKSLKLKAMWSKITKGTTLVTNSVFRSTKLFREGSSIMVLFFLQHGALRSYVTDHTAIVTCRNQFRSTQFPRMGPKHRLNLRAFLSTF